MSSAETTAETSTSTAVTALEPVIRVGAVTVAALARRAIRAGALGVWSCGVMGGAWFQGEKRPVAILVRREGRTTAFGPDGAPIPLQTLERRFPGQLAAFERLADAP